MQNKTIKICLRYSDYKVIITLSIDNETFFPAEKNMKHTIMLKHIFGWFWSVASFTIDSATSPLLKLLR